MSGSPITRPSLLLRLRDVTDEQAWRDFVRIYTPLIFGYCRRRNLQEADAADVAQEILCAVAAAMPAFDYDPQRGRFHGWLLQVTRHKVQNFFARSYRHPRPAGETTLERIPAEQPSPAEQAVWEEDYRQRLFLWAADKARPEFQPATWEAFWLTSVESLSVKETAARTGISAGAVYIARCRVVARLRELVESVADEPLPALKR